MKLSQGKRENRTSCSFCPNRLEKSPYLHSPNKGLNLIRKSRRKKQSVRREKKQIAEDEDKLWQTFSFSFWPFSLISCPRGPKRRWVLVYALIDPSPHDDQGVLFWGHSFFHSWIQSYWIFRLLFILNSTFCALLFTPIKWVLLFRLMSFVYDKFTKQLENFPLLFSRFE